MGNPALWSSISGARLRSCVAAICGHKAVQDQTGRVGSDSMVGGIGKLMPFTPYPRESE
mgnify:CR=1 FL=1